LVIFASSACDARTDKIKTKQRKEKKNENEKDKKETKKEQQQKKEVPAEEDVPIRGAELQDDGAPLHGSPSLSIRFGNSSEDLKRFATRTRFSNRRVPVKRKKGPTATTRLLPTWNQFSLQFSDTVHLIFNLPILT
jgi:hypothetical protein